MGEVKIGHNSSVLVQANILRRGNTLFDKTGVRYSDLGKNDRYTAGKEYESLLYSKI